MDEYHVFFCDRSYTIYAADENIHFSTTYRQLQVGGRKRYEICAPPNHQRRGKFVKAIGYSSDRIFDRTITGCRCIVLNVAYITLDAYRACRPAARRRRAARAVP